MNMTANNPTPMHVLNRVVDTVFRHEYARVPAVPVLLLLGGFRVNAIHAR